MLPELVDAALLARAETEADRPIAGGALFRVSEACLPCARPALFRALGVRPEITHSAQTLRRFEVGHQTAAWMSRMFSSLGVLVAEELPLVDPDWRLGGHVDFVVRGGTEGGGLGSADGTAVGPASNQPLRRGSNVAPPGTESSRPAPLIGIELKSVHSKSFWYKTRKNGRVAGDHQIMQAAMYDLLADRTGLVFDGGAISSWVVLSVSKDDLTMAEDFVTSRDVDLALERIELLNSSFDAGSLPECGCGEWFYKFCDYYPVVGVAAKDRTPGRCCPDSWLLDEGAA